MFTLTPIVTRDGCTRNSSYCNAEFCVLINISHIILFIYNTALQVFSNIRNIVLQLINVCLSQINEVQIN